MVKWSLYGLLLLFLLLALGYSAVTPAPVNDQHNPDEAAHMEYVHAIASGHLPVFTDAMHGYENHQPPLYYALCAPAYLAARGGGYVRAVKAVRGVSLVLGALLALTAFAAVREGWPEHPWLALGTAAFVALLPGAVSLASSVTNDALTNLLFAVVLWRMARLGRAVAGGAGGQRDALWLGAALGAGVWTKTSTLILFPTVLLLCYLLARQKIVVPVHAAFLAGISCGLGLLIGLPWLVRNQMLYGDPVAQHVFLAAFGQTAQAGDITRFVFGGSLGDYFAGVAAWTFASFWGVFDSMRLFWGQNPHGRTPSPAAPLSPLYLLLFAQCVLALLGLFLGRRRGKDTPAPVQSLLLPVFVTLTLLIGIVFLRFILTYFQAQGRYWYPALVPLAFFFVQGGFGLLPQAKWRPLFVGLLTLGLLALNLYTLFGLLVPRFG